jgi:hypothetical protein
MKSSLLSRFLLFAIVLVVHALESPSELLTPMGGLPTPQSSWRVGPGDDIGRFLRQVVEKRVGKQKTPNPQKRKNKLIKQMKKEGE